MSGKTVTPPWGIKKSLRTIWKFGPLTESGPRGSQFGSSDGIEMPDAAKIVHIGPDASGELHIWAFVDPKAERVQRKFLVYGTGHDIEELGLVHHGSALLPNGLVFHVFEKIP